MGVRRVVGWVAGIERPGWIGADDGRAWMP
jgi:hypothetical protein